jgi:uncharacterized membrane protein
MGMLVAERTVEIDAPRERCYAIIADLPSTPEWQESMISCDVLEEDSQGRAELVDVKSDAKVRQVTSRLRFSYDEPNGMTWVQEKGDMKSLDGRWELEDLGDGRTRATYGLEGDPGRMLGLLLRGPVEGKVKEFLTKDSAEGLKARAEATS